MAEKHTEHIGFNYITKLLNINEYNTNGNKELFNNKIPDGWLLKDDNLLIIEYKPSIDKKDKGINQLYHYAKIAISKKPNLNIYMFLGIGSNENNFDKIFIKYNNTNGSITYINENKVKDIFSNIITTYSLQNIHNMLVDNYKFEKAEDLHDILTIIAVSILDENFKKYYELSEDKIDKEFINDLVDLIETKITDSTISYKHIIESIKRIPFKNSFKICKTIYNQYNLNPKFLGLLFQQFKKYNKYVGSNNEVWTPPIIAELMYNIGKKYVKKSNITIMDPCIGFNALIYPWIVNDNITVKGVEKSSRLYFMGKLDLMIKGIDNPQTICDDFMKVDNNLLKSDICVCNPPYTKNISNGYDCLDFVIKATKSSKICIFIFPKARLISNKELTKSFIEQCKLLEVIELGNNIFRNVGTGNVVIIVVQRLNDKNKDIKTKQYNMNNLSKEYKNIPHKDEKILTDKGKKLINDYINGKLPYKEYIQSIDKLSISEDILNINNIKNNLLEDINRNIINIDSLSILSKNDKLCIKEKITNYIHKINQCNDLIELIRNITNNDRTDIKKVKLMDYFELVKFKSTKINDSSVGEYPLYGASKDNEPVKYINNYTIDTNGENWIQLNKDGSAGYCFIRNGKFSMNSHCLLLKVKNNYKDVINLDDNVNIISLQISNMGFGFDKAINNERLNNIKIYISI